jgi:hypothetical protein
MMMPPGVTAVLILFSRNHNHIAESLLSVNENGKYKPWNTLDDEGRRWYVLQLTNSTVVG